MKLMNVVRRVGSAAVLTAGTVSMAGAADLDFAPIAAAVSIGAVATAIVAMGAIKIVPNVAKWASNKLANFF